MGLPTAPPAMRFRDITESTRIDDQAPCLRLTLDNASVGEALALSLRPAVALGRVRWWQHGEDLTDWVEGDPAAFRAAICRVYGFRPANWRLACECLLVEADWAAVSAGFPCPDGPHPVADRWSQPSAPLPRRI